MKYHCRKQNQLAEKIHPGLLIIGVVSTIYLFKPAGRAEL
jgi:hypothetical protein